MEVYFVGISAIVSCITLIYTIYVHRHSDKIIRTVNAFNQLQTSIIQDIYGMGLSYWKGLSSTDDDSKLFTQYLYQLDTFCSCVLKGVYDYKTIADISGNTFPYLYKGIVDFRPTISSADSYSNFKTLAYKIDPNLDK